MPTIQSFSVRHLRNISSAELDVSPTLNVFYGENGSGKTSLLEALHLLGLARSFRSSSGRPLVGSGESEAIVSGKLSNGQFLGVKKTSRGRQEVKVGGKAAGSAADLAHELPLQLINSDTFSILDGAPKTRRGFLDWGVFHVEPLFLGNWRHALKSLQNRNALLKRQASDAEIRPWSQELARYGDKIDQDRARYIEKLKPLLAAALESLLPALSEDVVLSYERGWDSGSSLEEALIRSKDKDKRYGHTSLGPHRADIKFSLNSAPAIDHLSRGQQKMFICALKLAQSQLLTQEKNRQCIFLIDDLPAELDCSNRRRVCEVLEVQGQQVFMTCIEAQQLQDCWKNRDELKLFHVKHGNISLSA